MLLNATGDPDSTQYQLEFKASTDPDTSWKQVQLENN
jgi:hypothetical protein